MSEKITITLPYPPSANMMWRMDAKAGRMRTNHPARAYKKEVMVLCRQARLRAFPKKFYLNFTMRVFRPLNSGDLDNRIKLVLDSLNKHAFYDDRQIVEIHAYRFDDKDNPRIEVEIEQSRFIG